MTVLERAAMMYLPLFFSLLSAGYIHGSWWRDARIIDQKRASTSISGSGGMGVLGSVEICQDKSR